MRKFRLRVGLVELVALSLLASALGISALAGEEYQVTTTIQSPEPRSNVYFGWSTDVNGDFIVASDDWAYVEGLFQAGIVLIFDLDGNLKVTLQAPTPQLKGKFGNSVAISGDIVVVGEFWAEVDGLSKAGRAYIFDTDGYLLATLQSPEPLLGNWFGKSVDFSGDIIVVGEQRADVEEYARIVNCADPFELDALYKIFEKARDNEDNMKDTQDFPPCGECGKCPACIDHQFRMKVNAQIRSKRAK